MKRSLRVFGGIVVLFLLGGLGLYGWSWFESGRLLAHPIEAHTVDFPVPVPLSDAEVAELELSAVEAEALALERARERGRHLVTARYSCADCHGEDFGGGVMVDAPVMGRLLGPNLTTGQGSATTNYTFADWDRIVRHGIRPDGRPALMPSMDFQLMSDRELSDIVAYLEAQPPVDNEVPPVTLGPLGQLLVATRKMPLSATVIGAHDTEHAAEPPRTEASVTFGRHLAGVCTGCHGQELAGGPIPGGDPSWPPAKNLTPAAEGLAGWSFGEFVTAMRDGIRPDGSPLAEPMTLVTPYAQRMTDVEMEALWLYLRSLDPVSR